jgi:TRAP transporter TAXI family solute receptor
MEGDIPAAQRASQRKAFLSRLLPQNLRVFLWDFGHSVGPVIVVGAIAIFTALHFVRPAPPKTLTIAAGVPGSRFNLAALQYQKILKRNGITLNVVSTEGSLDNLNRLSTGRVDIALVQSGVAPPGDTADLVSLGSVFYVPLTVFYRNPTPIERLSQLRGQRIAIGSPGSGTRAVALALLKANEIDEQGPTQLVDLEGEAGRAALLERRVDALFLTGDSAPPETIREMLHTPGVRMFDFAQADAYVRRFHYLSKLELPPGSFDLGENLPPTAINMLAPTADLLAHSSLHPALSDLLIEAATEVHGGATLLQNAGQFPAPLVHDYPISTDAARYYKSGKSFAYRYLPFWLASLLDRAVVVLLPALLVIIPLLRYLPALYNWRIKSRIDSRYRQLMALERQSLEDLTPEHRALLVNRLAQIEKSVISLKMPGSHAEQLYVLRQHMQFVRENLTRAPPKLDEAEAPAVGPGQRSESPDSSV